jgi:sarcosine oxidase gamma subunit
MRAGISAEMVSALTDEELMKVRNLGVGGLRALRAAFPYAGAPAKGHTNTDDLSPDEWAILAEVAEREGYGDRRQSELLALVREGVLPTPIARRAG